MITAPMLDNLQKLLNITNNQLIQFKNEQTFCIPTIFGVLIGYPIVYWYDERISIDNCLSLVSLNVYQVIMSSNSNDDFAICSLSCPKSLICGRAIATIAKLFQHISSHNNLRLETQSKSMHVVNL